MNNSPHITEEDWERIRKYIAEGPSHVHIGVGGEIFFNGGVMHPRAYLQIMDDGPFEDEPVDILKNVSNASAPDALIGTMPGSLHGAIVTPWKPREDDEK